MSLPAGVAFLSSGVGVQGIKEHRAQQHLDKSRRPLTFAAIPYQFLLPVMSREDHDRTDVLLWKSCVASS